MNNDKTCKELGFQMLSEYFIFSYFIYYLISRVPHSLSLSMALKHPWIWVINMGRVLWHCTASSYLIIRLTQIVSVCVGVLFAFFNYFQQHSIYILLFLQFK